MRERIYHYLDSAITVTLLIIAGVTPLLMFNQTTEFYEIPKLIFLIFTTVLLLGLWVFSWILKGKISISRTPLDLALIFLLLAVIVSAFFSPTRLISIYGNLPRVHASAVAWVMYILLYFLAVSHFRKFKNIKYLLYVLCGTGVVLSIISLLSYFQIFLPISFAKSVNFTPTGSSFSTIAYLMMLIPLPILSLVNRNKYMPFPLAAALATLFGTVIVLISSVPYIVVLALIFVACLLISRPQQVKSNFKYFVGPAVIVALFAVLTYLPLTGPFGYFHNLGNNFPKEIQLSLPVSWKVTASTFRDAPFFGTGPSSYSFNFTSYKPAEFNTLPYWNFSFDTAYNEIFQLLATLGLFGLGAFVVVLAIVLRASKRNLSFRSSDTVEENEAPVILPALALSAIVAVVLLVLHATTLVSIVMTLFIFAAFMMAQKPIREKVTELSLGIKATTSGGRFDLFPVLVFGLYLVVAVFFLNRAVKAVAADYYHRQALSQSLKDGSLTYKYLQRAESLNPNVALYRVDMAQTNFALANAIALQKGPTEANPQGTLTDNDKQTIQTLLSQAINEGRMAVALSPRSAANWELLGSIYRNITGVAQNALEFSLASYGQAIQRDPLNPALRVNVGGIYYAGKNYPLAVRFFSDAANLKSDYANAYYNLAIAMRDNNDLANSVLVAQQLVNMLSKDTNSNDYKTAIALLADLKSKLESQQAQQASQQSVTTNQSTSALQNPNLPNVTTLDNPPTVSPAPTVRPNPNSNLPRPTVTPARRITPTP